jgi:hypothetical protein
MPSLPNDENSTEPHTGPYADWSRVLGKTVVVRKGQEIIRIGRVETVTHDCRNLWVESQGVLGRKLFSQDDGYTISPMQK